MIKTRLPRDIQANITRIQGSNGRATMWLRFFPLRLMVATAVAAFLMPTARAQEREQKNPELLVFAAASLTNVLGELSPAWEKLSGTRVKFSFAASSVLARQIEAGGSADVFVSADQEWMDYLAARDL